MSPQANDEIFLRGTTEFDTAIAALTVIDTNPDGLKSLTGIRDAIWTLGQATPEESERVRLRLQGGTTAGIRTDILAGLEILTTSDTTPEQKLAAQALLVSMTS